MNEELQVKAKLLTWASLRSFLAVLGLRMLFAPLAFLRWIPDQGRRER